MKLGVSSQSKPINFHIWKQVSEENESDGFNLVFIYQHHNNLDQGHTIQGDWMSLLSGDPREK